MKGKVLPQAIDVEESVLGAIILDSQSDEVKDILIELKPDLFYKEKNQIILESVLNLINKNEPADLITLATELKRVGKLNDVGGAYELTQLTNKVSTAANIQFHLKIVQQAYLRRQVIKNSSELITNAYDDTVDIFEIIDKSEKGVNEITANILTEKTLSVLEIHQQSIERNKKIINNTELTIGVPSGFLDLDRITGGWQSTDYIILAARPAMGKTSLMLEFVRNPALKNYPIGVFSLEMSNLQLYSRMQSQQTEYPLQKILRDGIPVEMQGDFYSKCEPLRNAPIYIDDTAGITMFELRNKARKLKRDKDIKLIVIDYLQLMNGEGYNKENEVSRISKALKELAKELEIPVIVLSQLSRAVETRGGDKIPMLSDLRDSGSIEQDADMVMFLHRPEYYGITEDSEGNSTLGKASIIIAKHRNGKIGSVILDFKQEMTKFSNPKTALDNFVEKQSAIENNTEFDNEQWDDVPWDDVPF